MEPMKPILDPQYVLNFDDYQDQTTTEGKINSLKRLRETLKTLKKNKKYE